MLSRPEKMLHLFDLTLKLNSFPIKAAKAELKRIVNLSEQEYALFLDNKKKEIVNYHINNNNFYKKLVGTNPNLNWEDLPILNKKNLQNCGLQVLTFLRIILLYQVETSFNKSGQFFTFQQILR